MWKNPFGLYIDRALFMAWKNAGLQALVQKVVPCVVWTYYMGHPSLVRNMRKRLFTKLCDDMGLK